MKRIWLVDNHDSFTYTIVHYLEQAGTTVIVQPYCSSLQLPPRMDGLVISPGPKSPSAYPAYTTLLDARHGLPIFGICLGMQILNNYAGGKTVPAPVPRHGKTSLITHEQEGIFAGVPSPFHAMRYHSLACDINAEEFAITAAAEDGVIMGMAHRARPWFGVQFHPESFRTERGHALIANFIEYL